MVDVAQLVRVPGCGPGGRRFDPDHPPHFLFKILYCIGVSSSGKTQHFDCCIRRFESCHPSQKKALAKAGAFFSSIRLMVSVIALL